MSLATTAPKLTLRSTSMHIPIWRHKQQEIQIPLPNFFPGGVSQVGLVVERRRENDFSLDTNEMNPEAKDIQGNPLNYDGKTWGYWR